MSRALLIVAIWFAATPVVSATAIQYSVAPLGGARWLFTYEITNDALPVIEEFSVFFNGATFANLSVVSSPPTWDAIVLQPDPGLPADGLFDALALVSGIPLPGALGGFTVVADFLGSGTPGSQPFQVIDPRTFAVLESGRTSGVVGPPPENAVDAPSSLSLCLGGMAALGAGLRTRRRRSIAGAAPPRAGRPCGRSLGRSSGVVPAHS
jgi:hypothetical protein